MADTLLEMLDTLPYNVTARVTIDKRTGVKFRLFVEDMTTRVCITNVFTREFIEDTDRPGRSLIRRALKSMKEIEEERRT